MASLLRRFILDRIDLVDAPANPGARVVLLKRDSTAKDAPGLGSVHVPSPEIRKDAPTKTEDGVAFPAGAYAYVPDPKSPSSWKLRLWESPTAKETAAQVGRAVAALGKGFRGEKVQIPASDLAGVKRKVLAAWHRVNPDAKPDDVPSVLKRSPNVAKTNILKRIATYIAKEAEAGALSDWAAEEETEPQHAESTGAKDAGYSMGALKAHHEELGAAIKSFGDPSKLPADHPVHKLMSSHKALGDRIAEHEAKEAAAAAKRKDAEVEADADAGLEDVMHAVGEPYGPQTGKPGVAKAIAKAIFGRVNGRMTAIEKRAVDAEARAEKAEKIAKAEKDARDLEGVRVDLRKCAKAGVDADKDAAEFLALKQASPAVYDKTIEKLNATAAQVTKADELQRELGSNRDDMTGEGTAWGVIEAEADKIVAKGDKGMTKHKAIDLVMKKRPDLVRKYYKEAGLSVN